MQNLEKFRKILSDNNLDALLLTSDVNCRYFCSTDTCEGTVLLTKNSCLYFTDSRYYESACAQLLDFQVVLIGKQGNLFEQVRQKAEQENIKNIGYEDGNMSVALFSLWKDAITADFQPVQEKIEELRSVKNEEELSAIREAQKITDKTFEELLPLIREGMTEKDLQAELIYRLYRHGAETTSFEPIVLFGEKTSLPHGISGSKKLSCGNFITMDFGCKVGGYCSDMTRTVVYGALTPEMRLVYDTVLSAQEEAISRTKAGMTGAEVDAIARKVITDAGYGEYFGHSYGHGIGLEIHEKPNCSPSWTKPLPAGAVCSAEPGIYLPGKFGVRIEDMVYITQDGCENLTHSRKNLIIL